MFFFSYYVCSYCICVPHCAFIFVLYCVTGCCQVLSISGPNCMFLLPCVFHVFLLALVFASVFLLLCVLFIFVLYCVTGCCQVLSISGQNCMFLLPCVFSCVFAFPCLCVCVLTCVCPFYFCVVLCDRMLPGIVDIGAQSAQVQLFGRFTNSEKAQALIFNVR